MHYTVALADVAFGPAVAVVGIFAALVALLLIGVGEAIVLVIVRWDGFGKCLVDSLLMNLVSGIVGLLAKPWLSSFATPLILLMFALSVVIEAVVLMLRRRHPPARTWLAALAANAASYAVIFLLTR